MYSRLADFPVQDEYPSHIPAATWNAWRRTCGRLPHPISSSLPGLEPMAMVLEQHFWVCFDPTLGDAPILASARFQGATEPTCRPRGSAPCCSTTSAPPRFRTGRSHSPQPRWNSDWRAKPSPAPSRQRRLPWRPLQIFVLRDELRPGQRAPGGVGGNAGGLYCACGDKSRNQHQPCRLEPATRGNVLVGPGGGQRLSPGAPEDRQEAGGVEQARRPQHPRPVAASDCRSPLCGSTSLTAPPLGWPGASAGSAGSSSSSAGRRPGCRRGTVHATRAPPRGEFQRRKPPKPGNPMMLKRRREGGCGYRIAQVATPTLTAPKPQASHPPSAITHHKNVNNRARRNTNAVPPSATARRAKFARPPCCAGASSERFLLDRLVAQLLHQRLLFPAANRRRGSSGVFLLVKGLRILDAASASLAVAGSWPSAPPAGGLAFCA